MFTPRLFLYMRSCKHYFPHLSKSLVAANKNPYWSSTMFKVAYKRNTRSSSSRFCPWPSLLLWSYPPSPTYTLIPPYRSQPLNYLSAYWTSVYIFYVTLKCILSKLIFSSSPSTLKDHSCIDHSASDWQCSCSGQRWNKMELTIWIQNSCSNH